MNLDVQASEMLIGTPKKGMRFLCYRFLSFASILLF